MHNNFELLESKCKKYHLKKMLKIILPIAFILLVSIISLLFVFEDEKKLEQIKTNNTKKQKIEEEVEDIFNKRVPIQDKAAVEIIEPDIFEEDIKITKIEDVEYNLHLYSYKPLNKKRDKTIYKAPSQNKIVEKKIINKKVNQESKLIVKPKDNSFSIVLKNLDSTDKMIEVYNKEKTYSIALKIAKLFYEKKDYKESLNWSRKANTIDSRAEEAWLIYAKSEYALGNDKRAKAILKIYINNSNSKKAKSLLISWTKGIQK